MAVFRINPNNVLILSTTQVVTFVLEGTQDGRALVNAPNDATRQLNLSGTAQGQTIIYRNPNLYFSINRLSIINISALNTTVGLYQNTAIDPSRLTGDIVIPAGGSAVLDDTGIHIYSSSGSPVVSGSIISRITEVDFGEVLYQTSKEFTISDAEVVVASKILAEVAYEDPTGRSRDEVAAENLSAIAGQATTGSFKLFITGNGSITGKFKIRYFISN